MLAPMGALCRELDVRVADARGGLSGNDERILGFLRDHLHELASHTAESLAQGVSAAAVVRFSRRLGFASVRELRDRARDELQADRVAEPATSASMLARKVQRDVASLGILPELLDEPLEAAAALIAGARTTWFLGNGETYGLAVYAQRLRHQVRDDVRLVDPSFADALRSLSADDVMVGCTFRPYARLTLLLSFTPAVCVLEALAARVAMMNADHTHAMLEASARFAEEHDLVASPAAAARGRRTR
jgi:DNA-binding MurR/RpiR family transcriptional regulator